MISLSIIMPTYKRQHILRETVTKLCDSIDAAKKYFVSHIARLQLILVNDDPSISLRGSIDDIVNKRFSVKYIDNKENLGLAGARNAGMRKVTTNFVICLDDDDELLPDYWQYVVPVIDREQMNHDFFYHDKYIAYVDYIPTHTGMVTSRADKYTKERIRDSNFLSVHQVTFRANIADGHSFDTTLKYNEDWDWWSQLLLANKNRELSVLYIPYIACVYNFRCKRASNMALDRNDALYTSHIEVRRRNEERFNA